MNNILATFKYNGKEYVYYLDYNVIKYGYYDSNKNILSYGIYESYEVEPDNLSYLSQETNRRKRNNFSHMQ